MTQFNLELSIERLLGRMFGRYQLCIYLLDQLSCFTLAVNMAFMMFAGSLSRWACPEDDELLRTFGEASNDSYTNFSVPNYGHDCSAAANCTNRLLYENDFHTIIAEVALTAYGFFFVFGLLSAISWNWIIFCAFRFVIGFLSGAAITTQYVLLNEMVPKKHRLLVNSIGGWGPSYIVFALVAYLAPSWKRLTVIGNLPALLYLVGFSFIFESPRWLIQNHRYAEAKRVIANVNRFNRVEITEDEIEHEFQKIQTAVEKEERKHKHYSFHHLFSTGKFALHISVLSYSWFSIGAANYGLVFNVGNLGGSKYVNTAVMGALRVVFSLSVIVLDKTFKKFGRRQLHVVPEVTQFIACGTIVSIIALGKQDELSVLVTALAIVSVCLNSPNWICVYLLAAELMPTPVRTLANSFCSIFSRIGSIIAPQILYIAEYWKAAPYAFFGSVLIIDAILSFSLLPETKGQALPQRMPSKYVSGDGVV